LLLICFHPFFGQGQQLKVDSLLYDYTILETALKENHPLIVDHISKERFAFVSDSLKTEIAKGQNIHQFYRSLSCLLTEVGCGHTRVYPYEEAKRKAITESQLPFSIRVKDTSIFISDPYHPDYASFDGKEITAINGMPAAELIRSAYRIISADGKNVTYKRRSLEKKFYYYANLLLDLPDKLDLTVDDSIHLSIACPSKFRMPDSLIKKASFTEREDLKGIVMLTLPDFDEGRRTIKKCFAYLDKKKTGTLVIDLRFNGGGNGNIGALLLSYLIDSTHTYYLDKKTKPFPYKEYMKGGSGLILSNQYIQTDSVTKSYYFRIRPRSRDHFKGEVRVLVNGGTFSTAAFVASVLKYKTKAVISGEESGGSEYAIGGGVIARLELPYSQLSVKFPLYRWRFNTAQDNKGCGVMPDPDPLFQIKSE
jgi:hypothetical protein